MVKLIHRVLFLLQQRNSNLKLIQFNSLGKKKCLNTLQIQTGYRKKSINGKMQ